MRFNSDFDVIKGEDIYLQIAEHNPGLIAGLPYYKYGIYLDDGTLVGNITVRIGHNFHSHYSGNFVYQIRGDYRGRNLAVKALNAIMVVPKYHAMDYVILAAEYDHLGYLRTFEKIGAKLLEVVTPPQNYLFYFKDIKPHAIYRLDI
ncbi:MAG: hypothetical protein BWY30_00360 [Tenericutes bacterium ADurb.Bin239]|jgi:predicted acetyltransferase|nr:MAG: hypothetical protein BWY30_00360 [Tenericutes bacterium ADurb.Bin239]